MIKQISISIRDRKKEIDFENYFAGLGKQKHKNIQEDILKQLEGLYCLEDYD